jgi:hypothetical protein
MKFFVSDSILKFTDLKLFSLGDRYFGPSWITVPVHVRSKWYSILPWPLYFFIWPREQSRMEGRPLPSFRWMIISSLVGNKLLIGVLAPLPPPPHTLTCRPWVPILPTFPANWDLRTKPKAPALYWARWGQNQSLLASTPPNGEKNSRTTASI